jgi:hypothetical protein
MVESIWISEVRVIMRKMIDRDVRVRVGGSFAKCWCDSVNEQ